MSYADFTDYGTYENEGPHATLLGIATPVAKQEHTCTHCRRTINPGERYRRYRLIVDGIPGVQKECDDCIYAGWTQGLL